MKKKIKNVLKFIFFEKKNEREMGEGTDVNQIIEDDVVASITLNL
jgi:hypothetical protein